MGISTILGVASLVIGAAGTAFSVIEQQKGKKDQKRARALEGQKQQAQERRRRRGEIRRQRIARAQLVNAGGQVGAGGSSGVLGGLGSLSSQLGSSQGFASQIAGLNTGISAANQSAADRFGRANMFSGFGQLGQSVIGSVGGFFRSPSGGGSSPFVSKSGQSAVKI